MKAYK